jgi:hypothetical protein
VIWTRPVVLLFCALTGCSEARRSPVARPAQIILIRHGERPADPNDPHLSPVGTNRAQELVPFITTDAAMTRFGMPIALFATRTTKHDTGVRTQETLEPLASALKLKVQTPYLGSNYAELAKAILADPAYAGKTVLICWNHEYIPQLVAELGVTPEPKKWKGSVFDLVYVISYKNGSAELQTSRYGGR